MAQTVFCFSPFSSLFVLRETSLRAYVFLFGLSRTQVWGSQPASQPASHSVLALLFLTGLGHKSCQEEEGSQYVNQVGQSGEDAVGG